MTILNEALHDLGEYFGLNTDELIAYAQEDTIGGFHMDLSKRRWNTGSMWEVEGQFLYAYIRAAQPETILEIGTWEGCSTTHILTALEKNGSGRLVSIDLNGSAGSQVPDTLKTRWTFIGGDAIAWLDRHPEQRFDMVLEDGAHSFEFTRDVLLAAKKTYPRAVFSHDGMHFLVGDAIRRGFLAALGEIKTVLIDSEPQQRGNMCGFAYAKLEQPTKSFGKQLDETIHYTVPSDLIAVGLVHELENAADDTPTEEIKTETTPKRKPGRPKKGAKP